MSWYQMGRHLRTFANIIRQRKSQSWGTKGHWDKRQSGDYGVSRLPASQQNSANRAMRATHRSDPSTALTSTHGTSAQQTKLMIFKLKPVAYQLGINKSLAQTTQGHLICCGYAALVIEQSNTGYFATRTPTSTEGT